MCGPRSSKNWEDRRRTNEDGQQKNYEKKNWYWISFFNITRLRGEVKIWSRFIPWTFIITRGAKKWCDGQIRLKGYFLDRIPNQQKSYGVPITLVLRCCFILLSAWFDVTYDKCRLCVKGHIRPKNWEMYHKLNCVVEHKVSKSFTSCRKWSCRCQQESSRWSQGMRWCWIQGRGQRALQGRPRSPQDPFWCFAQTLQRFQMTDYMY